MAKIHKYLFLSINNQISVFTYNKSETLENICYKGEKCFSISEFNGIDAFWKWWKNSTSFKEGIDVIDFCFICDSEDSEMKCDYKAVEESSWTLSEIINILVEGLKIKPEKICLINTPDDVQFINCNEKQYVLFTAHELKNSIEYNENETDNIDKQLSLNIHTLENPLAEYFIDLKNNQK